MKTLDEALDRADEMMSLIEADALAACENMIRDHGGTEEEVRIQTEWLAGEYQRERLKAFGLIRRLFTYGVAHVH